MVEYCPCGSGVEYVQCCQLFHKGTKQTSSAEMTMKARYSAYVKGEIGYIEKTHNPNKKEEFNVEEVTAWSKNAIWLGIEILNVHQGSERDHDGVVEFIASYMIEGKKLRHRERSSFQKINGEWFFMDGEMINETVRRDGPKVGRNDNCPCGSGKKYKKCCLAN